MKRLMQIVLWAGLGVGLAAHAADPATDAMQQAYAPYRAALFRTNSQAQAESVQAIAQARQAWQSIIERFGKQPPLPYAGDAAFGSTLADVARVYVQAAHEIEAGQLTQAHETLERVRDLLAELRQRNGVVVYSDHMNAYHAEMEHVLQQGKALAATPEGRLTLIERVGVLGYLADRLRSEAPSSLAGNASFTQALSSLEASVSALRRAALAQDPAAIGQALGQLKKPYSQLFLKFG